MNSRKRIEIQRDIEEWIEEYGGGRAAILSVLEKLMEKYKKLDGFALQEIAFKLDMHPSEIYGTSTFYSFLNGRDERGEHTIRLCKTISCHMKEKERIAKQLTNELGIGFGETTKDKKFTLEYCNCLGMCDQGPAMLIDDTLVARVQSYKIPELIKACLDGSLKERYRDTVVSTLAVEGPILKEKYTRGKTLSQVLEKAPEKVLKDIEDAGLRGRGGAGFPTGVKWRLAMEEENNLKYVICNADEGEPGTFKDRFLLHKHFSRVVEGMCIAAYVIGATKGYIYLRGEYFYLKDKIEEVITQWREEKLLGEGILSSSLDFDIEVRMGAGAYICGEETALIESLEGKRGEPRNKPPFPVDTGFLGNPTIVNNVETFLWASLICEKGVDFFEQYGTSKSKGTKFFSISGDCKREGVYELPFGITIDKIVELSGGVDIKAVQIGGAAGVCVPEKDFHRRIAFEAIPTGGSIILFNRERDLLDVAENFMDFFVEESCGQCTPCREGTTKILEGIRLLKKGNCSMTYLEKLLELSETIELASKCGLGQLSVKAFKSIVENFREEVLGRLPREV